MGTALIIFLVLFPLIWFGVHRWGIRLFIRGYKDTKKHNRRYRKDLT